MKRSFSLFHRLIDEINQRFPRDSIQRDKALKNLSNELIAQDRYTQALALISDISSEYEKLKIIHLLLRELLRRRKWQLCFNAISVIKDDEQRMRLLSEIIISMIDWVYRYKPDWLRVTKFIKGAHYCVYHDLHCLRLVCNGLVKLKIFDDFILRKLKFKAEIQKEPYQKSRFLSPVAKLYYLSGRKHQGIELFEIAYDNAKQVSCVSDRVRAISTIAFSLNESLLKEHAISLFKEAEKETDLMKDPKERFAMYTLIAEFMYLCGLRKIGFESLRRYELLAEEIDSDFQKGIAFLYLGLSYEKLGFLSLAQRCLQKSERLIGKDNFSHLLLIERESITDKP